VTVAVASDDSGVMLAVVPMCAACAAFHERKGA
jgi:hypothetical protein